MKRLVVGALIGYAIIAAIFLVWGTTDAADTKCERKQVTLCHIDPFGSPPPKPTVVGLPLKAPAPVPALLPSTDTDNRDAITVIAIWVTAIIVIVFCWHYMAYHDE